nr:DUF6036 family nucleotidyltransferase [uncultured Vagococcus sp.]
MNASFILVGGAALILTLAMHNREVRTTRDIDVSEMKVNAEKKAKLLAHFELLTINSNVDSVLFPPGAETLRDGEYKEFNDGYINIRVYVVTPEMLIVTKALTKRSRDLDDILNEDLLEIIDPQRTIDLIKEYNPFSNDPELNKNDILPKLEEML